MATYTDKNTQLWIKRGDALGKFIQPKLVPAAGASATDPIESSFKKKNTSLLKEMNDSLAN